MKKKEVILAKLFTADGHRAILKKISRPAVLFSSTYWLYVYSKQKGKQKHMLCGIPHATKEEAEKAAKLWTLQKYINSISEACPTV